LKLLGLSEIDSQLLLFFTYLNSDSELKNIANLAGDLDKKQLIDLLAWVLNAPQKLVTQALNSTSVLHQSGLLKVDKSGSLELERKVDCLDGLVDLMTNSHNDTQSFIKNYVSQSQPPELTDADFQHLSTTSEPILKYLTQNQHKGINVLVYGPPGTGKTQWVKWMASRLQKELYEVSSEDEDGDALGALRRLDRYKLAQRALRQQSNCLLMFDEVEDVFQRSIFSFLNMADSRRSSSNSKSWLNKVLEENPVPSFWISNHIDHIDPAYIRRFDWVVEMDIPPRSVRRKLIERNLKNLPVSVYFKDTLAEHTALSPATLERTTRVVSQSSTKNDVSSQALEKTLLDAFNATLQAQGLPKIVFARKESVSYSLDFLNTDVDLKGIVSGLKIAQQGRFCLYGLPGTGKTAFGHYLAKAIDKPLMIKRASDLLSPYVGLAEKNIAAAFQEAQKENAILQIDEADSFLRSRDLAKQSWEVTQVNELLTQMESFEGIFIASTNLMDNLDAAAMRRFDFKISFKALKNDQAWLFLSQLLAEFKVTDFDENALRLQLKSLHNLTPGDFATVSRKLTFSGQIPNALWIVEALGQECKHKPDYPVQQGMGFMSQLVS
jgi:transitional endoplasmic reticulum ATPase